MGTKQSSSGSGGVLRENNTSSAERIAELYKEGKKLKEICEITGRARITVTSWIKKLGLNNRHKKAHWTAEEEELIRRGIRPPGHSSDSIRYKSAQLGVPLPPPKAGPSKKLKGDLLQTALELRESGMPASEIAKKIGFNKKTVAKEFRKLGVDTSLVYRRGGFTRQRRRANVAPQQRVNVISREQELELMNSFPIRRMPAALTPEFKDVPLMTFNRKSGKYGRPELSLP